MLVLCAAALVAGLLGSLHCAGMCGPLAIAVACGRPCATKERLVLFVAGKGLTYVALGAVAGTFGAGLSNAGLGNRAAAVVALAAGVAMLGFGVSSVQKRFPSMRPNHPSAVSVLITQLVAGQGQLTPLAAGLLAGLLPCGLVHAMLAQSMAAVGAWRGCLVMLAFGLGSSPSVLAAGWLCGRIGIRSRRMAEWLGAGAVVGMGMIALWRGLALLLADPSAGASCTHAAM